MQLQRKVLAVLIAAVVIVAVVAGAYVFLRNYEGRAPSSLPAMPTAAAQQVLTANVSKRVRVTFADGIVQSVDIDSVDDEGFLHSGPDGSDPAKFWTRFDYVARVQTGARLRSGMDYIQRLESEQDE